MGGGGVENSPERELIFPHYAKINYKEIACNMYFEGIIGRIVAISILRFFF
jgi:hypothetical protein